MIKQLRAVIPASALILSLAVVMTMMPLPYQLFLWPVFMILILDAFARREEYLNIRASAEEMSPELFNAILRKMRGSFCQRWACIWAMHDIHPAKGLATAIWYEAHGYRPWHIFPDHTFTRNSPFFKRAFWRNLLGAH